MKTTSSTMDNTKDYNDFVEKASKILGKEMEKILKENFKEDESIRLNVMLYLMISICLCTFANTMLYIINENEEQKKWFEYLMNDLISDVKHTFPSLKITTLNV